MIIVQLIGGLGNQMFQYAFARKLSTLKNVPVKLDIFWYLDIKFGSDSVRKYSLDIFNVQENIATREDVAKFLNKRGLVYKVIKKFKRDVLKIDSFSFNDKFFDTPDDCYLEGFWQSEKYFSDIREILLKEFTLKNGLGDVAKNIEAQELDGNSVALHIRRGDYVSDKKVSDSIGVCDMGYYYQAIDMIKEKISQPTFFVYSDDIDWVKENLKIDAPCVFVSRPELKDCEELVLMSKCKHNIRNCKPKQTNQNHWFSSHSIR